MDPQTNKPDWNDFEASLARLVPRPAVVDRDRLMFLAGQASVGRTGRRPMIAWLSGASLAANLLLALALGALWMSRAAPIGRGPSSGHLAKSESAADDALAERFTEAAGPARSELRYLTLRRLVLQRGVEALPESPSGSAGAGPPVMRAREIDWAIEQLPQG